jgi:hypothetical protein
MSRPGLNSRTARNPGAFTIPAFAGDVTKAKTEADCKKAGGMWDAKTKMCLEKKM